MGNEIMLLFGECQSISAVYKNLIMEIPTTICLSRVTMEIEIQIQGSDVIRYPVGEHVVD